MNEPEINLLDYWKVLTKNKKLILLISFSITLLSIIYSLLLSNIYKAKCTLMPIKGYTASNIAQLGGGMLGGLMGLKESKSDQLLAIMNSQTLAERVVNRPNLRPLFFPDIKQSQSNNSSTDSSNMVRAIALLQSLISIEEDEKSHLITVSVVRENPEETAQIANGYLDELVAYINENTFTSAKKNRLFLEEQLKRNKIELLNSGKELSLFYSTNKISNVVPFVNVNVSPYSNEILSQHNGGVIDDVSNEVTHLEVAHLQDKLEATKTQFQQANIVKDIPQQVYLQYLVIQRELLGQLNVLLSQQYEMAKIEETKEDLSFQIIDRARVPVGKYKPRRRSIVTLSFANSFFLAIFVAFFREYFEKIKAQELTTRSS